jgi:hypothetical protein
MKKDDTYGFNISPERIKESKYVDKIASIYMKRKKRAIGFREMDKVIQLAKRKNRKKKKGFFDF